MEWQVGINALVWYRSRSALYLIIVMMMLFDLYFLNPSYDDIIMNEKHTFLTNLKTHFFVLIFKM